MHTSAWRVAARLLALGALGALGLAMSSSAVTACSTDVNLGGTPDAGASDLVPSSEEFGDLCEPCLSSLTCPVDAVCVQIAGNNKFCATSCPRGTECDIDDVCHLASLGVGGDTVRACVPKTGACATAKPPESDSSPIEHCGNLDGPSITAACKSCDRDDKDCQRNGCYGGWWCNDTTNRCQKPPASCPT